jgi:hypothetical protein
MNCANQDGSPGSISSIASQNEKEKGLDPRHAGENHALKKVVPEIDSGENYSAEMAATKGPFAQLHPSSLSTISDGKPFADLVRTFETYIADGAADQFHPMLNNICGAGHNLARLETPTTLQSSTGVEEPRVEVSEPVALRHIHSTPLVHIPSILDDDDDEPPPIGLEILNRSRSTPLSTSANSAFGTIARLHLPSMGGLDDRSAFTLPPYRLKPTLSEELVSSHHTVFNPIKYDKELESVEQTAIEVVDLPLSKPKDAGEDLAPPKTTRAARFLSDVRNLRRRRKTRDGRENPARPPSVSDEPRKKDETLGDEDILSSESSAESQDREKNAAGHGEETSVASNRGEENTFENTLPRTPVYHRLLDERNPVTSLVPSNKEVENYSDNPASLTGRVRIQVSTTEGQFALADDRLSYTATSPETCQSTHDPGMSTPQSHDSPETSRSSGTTLTSGHTTQGTATTCSSGHISNLSVISETDLEVMQANKVGRIRRSQGDQPGRVASTLSCRQLQYPGYIEVSDGPAPLREGASVPAERFFTLADSSPNDKRGFGARLRNAASLRRNSSVNSPNTLSSSSMTTNSSTSSQDEPPTFVSYLDRKMASDLTSLREMDERSSPREDHRGREERESSPAELLGYLDATFEEAQAPPGYSGPQAKPRPIWPSKGFQFGRKVRSLPPRSPHKGLRTPTTPPPRGSGASPVYDAVSPPRHFVGHRICPNVSRPYVLRSVPSTRLLAAHKVSPEVLSSSGNVNYAHIPDADADQGAYEVVRMGTDCDSSSSHYYVTQSRGSSPKAYNEQSIEVLKTDSKEESSPTFVTPVKHSST